WPRAPRVERPVDASDADRADRIWRSGYHSTLASVGARVVAIGHSRSPGGRAELAADVRETDEDFVGRIAGVARRRGRLDPDTRSVPDRRTPDGPRQPDHAARTWPDRRREGQQLPALRQFQ